MMIEEAGWLEGYMYLPIGVPLSVNASLLLCDDNRTLHLTCDSPVAQDPEALVNLAGTCVFRPSAHAQGGAINLQALTG